jgi:hypothetical protein
MQVAQGRQGARQVVKVVDGEGQRVAHLLAVVFDLDGAAAQIQVREVGLGGGEGQEGPAGGRLVGYVQPGQAGDASPAEGTQLCPHLSKASVT